MWFKKDKLNIANNNPKQVSVGIELDNGHEATWNGKEFEIDDLGCPLLLGKG